GDHDLGDIGVSDLLALRDTLRHFDHSDSVSRLHLQINRGEHAYCDKKQGEGGQSGFPFTHHRRRTHRSGRRGRHGRPRGGGTRGLPSRHSGDIVLRAAAHDPRTPGVSDWLLIVAAHQENSTGPAPEYVANRNRAFKIDPVFRQDRRRTRFRYTYTLRRYRTTNGWVGPLASGVGPSVGMGNP